MSDEPLIQKRPVYRLEAPKQQRVNDLPRGFQTQEPFRIEPLAFAQHFVMQVRTGRTARGTHQPHQITSLHHIACLNIDFGEMAKNNFAEQGGDRVLPAALNAHGLAKGAEQAGQAFFDQGVGGVLCA